MIIILTWGAGISCNYSFNMLRIWAFLILELLPKYSPGIAKPEHRWKGPMDQLSGRSLGCKSLFIPWSGHPPANRHPLLRKRKKGIWKGTEFTELTQKGIVTTSDSEATEVCICLLSGEIRLDVSRQPSVFHRSCPGSHCSTWTPTKLGWQRALHPKNLSNYFHPPGGSGWKAPVWSIKAFFPPPEKEDETQRLSSASWPLSSRAVEGEQAAGTVGGDTPATLAAVEVWPQAQTPWTGIQDCFIKTSQQFPSPCGWVSIFAALASSSSSTLRFLFSIIEGLELGPALRFPYCKALSLHVLQKPQEIISSYYLEKI